MEKKLGFGCMRLPMIGDEVDLEEFQKMVDYSMKYGFNYFDTAHGYVKQKSELALKNCLTSKYDRNSYILTNKLSVHFFNKEEQIRPLFEQQLKVCGVEYFDYYLMHAQDKAIYQYFQECNAYKIVQELKKEGKIKHMGISFHDKADVLNVILKEHPEIEIVQIQLNYKDYEDASVQSRAVYEVCRKYNKPVLIMEPVKGGGLVNLPNQTKAVFDELHGGSYANYAIRFAASLDGVYKVLSGMSNMEQLKDNISYMKDFQPLNKKEYEAIDKVKNILDSLGGIDCTACCYCVDGCPKKILIPDLFACYNAKVQFNDWNSDYYYDVHTKAYGKASDCTGCKQCEKICPQHLTVTKYLKEISKIFDK